MLAKSTKNSIILATSIVIVALVLGFTFIFGGVAGGNVLAATSYTINYDANGGTLTGSSTQTVNQGDTITLPNVEKVGYSARWIDQTTPTGTAITTAAQLVGISSSGTYYLANDIDLSSYSNWTPISSFSGTLDGRGHSIKNLKITSTSECSGLFGKVSGGVYKNINLANINITASYSNELKVGGLIGSSTAIFTVSNCIIDGIINARSSYWVSAGGIVGGVQNNSVSGCIIKNCTNNTKITVINTPSWVFAGGIYGRLDNTSTITNCLNMGNITVSSNCKADCAVSGLCGDNENSGTTTITNCYNIGVVTASSTGSKFCAGINARIFNSSKITNCFNAGNCSGAQINYSGATVSNCYYLSGTTGTAQGTAIADVATLASTFYNNMSSTDKENWNYTAGSYPTLHFYDLNLSGNIGDKKCIGASTTVKASYTVNTYTIAYNGNGATSGVMDNQTITFDTNTITRTNTFTLTGFTFVGWATTASAREPTYANGFNFDTYPVGANNNGATFTLYAIWKSTLNLDQQGGSGGTASITGTYNLNMPAATKPTFANFTFGGYYTQIGGQGVQYYDANMASKHIYDLPSGKTLYAYWTSTINLDQQSGVNGTTSVTGTYNLAMPAITAPTRNGYTFGGYFTEIGGKGTQYYTNEVASAHVYDLPSGTTLYAKWTCTVILDQQGGADGTASVNPVYNATMPSANAPKRTGWTFGGYYTQVGGGGKQYYTKDMASANKWAEVTNVTLYAKWTATVALNMEGGSNGTSSITVTYNAPMPTATAPVRTGYAFAGYYTESNGNGTRFYSDTMASVQNWNLSVNTALYAKWVANVYTVTFEYNGATEGNEIASKNVSFGNFYSDLPLPSKAGSSFAGWYLEDTYQTAVTSTTVVSTPNNHTIYAKWSTWLILHVSGASNSVKCISEINDLYTRAQISISPGTGKYVSAFSFDNSIFYPIDCYSNDVGDLSFAVSVSYRATTTSNQIGFFIDFIYDGYFDNFGAIHLYLITTDTPYDNLRKNGGGSVTNVAVSASYGGSVTLIGYDYDNMGDNDLITVKANVCVNGYQFLGWYATDNELVCLSKNESEKFAKSLIYERQIVAKFGLIGENSDYNGDKNN